MSEEIPGDPEELSRWLKRETNLRYDICKPLRGRQFSFFLFVTWSVHLSYDSVMVTYLFESQKLVFVRPNSRSEDSLNGKVLLIFINRIVPVTESRQNHPEIMICKSYPCPSNYKLGKSNTVAWENESAVTLVCG